MPGGNLAPAAKLRPLPSAGKAGTNCNNRRPFPERNVTLDMKTWGLNAVEDWVGSHAGARARFPAAQPNNLHLVTIHDLRELGRWLAQHAIPRCFEAKLERLAEGDFGERLIEQNCRTIIALLLAAQEGSFKKATPEQSERFLRLLAYVHKDDDAIPDYRPHGFDDDWREVRTVTAELGELLRDFKAWRLRHQVPGMWVALNPAPHSAHAAIR